MYISAYVLVLVSVLLVKSILAQSSAPQTAKEVVQAALTSVGNFKSDFENVKLKRDREFRNKLFDVINAVYDQLFNFLEEEVFKPEDAKAIALSEALKDTNEQYCVTRLRDFNSDIKNKEGRSEYRFCFADLEAEIGQLREKLSYAQENINALTSEAEQKIQTCERVYNLRGNFSHLKTCVEDAQANQKKAPADLDKSYQNLTTSKLATEVGSCIDRTVLVIKKSLNANYEQIQKCLNTSTSDLAKQVSTILPSYRYAVISNAKNDVIEALENLKAKPSVTLENTATTKIKVDQTLTKKNRNTDAIKILLGRNENVMKYESALFNASLALVNYNNAKSCVNDAQNRFRDTINARANDIKQCQDGIKQTVSVGDISSFENNVVERQRGEAQVAVILCLSSSGTVAEKSAVVCSAQADEAFENYLLSVDQKLNQANQRADVISEQINTCEKNIVPSVQSTLTGNKYQFEYCLLNKALVNFTLSYT